MLYRNPKPLIQIQPKMLIDQKNRKAFATGGDILLANGEKIPLPGGFALPTTGLWSELLDIPAVSAWLPHAITAAACALMENQHDIYAYTLTFVSAAFAA
jgi:hypothetical protein